MKSKNIFICVGLLLSVYISHAQVKNTTHISQVWTAYFNQTRFSNKWGMWADIHIRTKEKVFGANAFLLSGTLKKKLYRSFQL